MSLATATIPTLLRATTCLLLLALGTGASAKPSENAQAAVAAVHTLVDFAPANWYVEQMPGGKVLFHGSSLEIVDKGGCTVWLRTPLNAPVTLRFKARLIVEGGELDRLSDLNCFWMATDPARPDLSVLIQDKPRTGAFAEYDALSCYYVGMGGNHNTTTRFRRYAGGGPKPLLPQHDLQSKQHLLEANRDYVIEIESRADGITYRRDGVVFFNWLDPQAHTHGWFGFRTVWSHLRISDFSITKGSREAVNSGQAVRPTASE